MRGFQIDVALTATSGMPGHDGIWLVEQMRRHHPGASRRSLLRNGIAGNGPDGHPAARRGRLHRLKPFNRDEISTRSSRSAGMAEHARACRRSEASGPAPLSRRACSTASSCLAIDRSADLEGPHSAACGRVQKRAVIETALFTMCSQLLYGGADLSGRAARPSRCRGWGTPFRSATLRAWRRRGALPHPFVTMPTFSTPAPFAASITR